MDSLLSDFDSLSESWSSEDQDDLESLFGGQARSIFSSLEETIEKIDDFLLFERRFMQGDIVCMISDPLGQTGKVVNVSITIDLENIYGSKTQNMSTKNLRKIRSMSVGDYVVRGAWIGKVEKIVDRVTVLFDDGTKSQLIAGGSEKIIAISPDLIEDPQYPFYPGQRVKVEPSSVSTTPRWLCGTREDKQEHGTVCSVEAGFVYVDWLSCAVIKGEKGIVPPCMQDSKELILLSSFTHANWQLGDWCIPPTEASPNIQQIGVIVKTKTKVDVQWQDGSQSLELDSHLLYPVNVIDIHDFWPDTFVLEKGTIDDWQVPSSQRWGIVNCVDSKERTVKVKWYKSSLDLGDTEEEQMEEIVSAYELVEHPEYSYCVGEAVFRVDHTMSKMTTDAEANLMAVENGGENVDYLDRSFLSHIGVVVGFKSGYIEVKWATGTTSKVAPYEVCRVDKSEGTTISFVLSEENVQQSYDDTQAKENQLLGQKDISGINCDYGSSSYSLSQIAVGVFTSIASNLFGSLSASLIGARKFTSEDGKILDNSSEEELVKLCNLTVDGQHVVDDLVTPENKPLEQIKESNEDNTMQSTSKHLDSFEQFDMVSDCSDHHFVDGPGKELQSTQTNRGWLKKVRQEWGILEKGLPETIYVRSYEERMDLLRAAIVGSKGTPYHDNLFFFDICLPPQYPNEPPMVFYHSGGLRINPNLYESGKVCLSLLNTWTGSNSEVWNPGSSTILQVLLSLQALVLNEKPYFNEAGYDAQMGKAEGEKNSVSYNENAFLVSCRSMLYVLRRPPKHFEALVDEHFSSCGRDILLACKAYMQGAPIGYPFSSETVAPQENQKRSSTGFKIMLSKLIPRLVEAFADKGIDYDDEV